jgi:hypothetical protein
MNRFDEPRLEETLRGELAALAPEPGPDLLHRTLASVARTPQRSAVLHFGFPSIGLGWVSAVLVATAGIVVGIAIGTTLGPTIGEVTPPAASATMRPTATAATSTPTATDPAPSPHLPPTSPVRLDLPDPAVGVFSAGGPSDVIFAGGYIAVGSIAAGCTSDIADPPAGCTDALDELPTRQAAAIWVSSLGRGWELLPHREEFEGARMTSVGSDGRRHVVVGQLLDTAEPRPAIWIATDNVTDWQLVEPEAGALVPDLLAGYADGFIGVRSTDDGPQFLRSEDGGFTWRATTQPGEMGPGEVLAMRWHHQAYVAVGVTYDYTESGDLESITATTWHSADGRSWERGRQVDGADGAWMSAVAVDEFADDDGATWVAVGLDQTTDAEPADEMAVWTSTDGISWDRVPSHAIERVTDGAAHEVVWTRTGTWLAAGTVDGTSGSAAAFWTSVDDGQSWQAVPVEPEGLDGTPTGMAPAEWGAVAIGSRFEAPDHLRGVAWLVPAP